MSASSHLLSGLRGLAQVRPVDIGPQVFAADGTGGFALDIEAALERHSFLAMRPFMNCDGSNSDGPGQASGAPFLFGYKFFEFHGANFSLRLKKKSSLLLIPVFSH